jgi:hypothetical protein
MAMNDTQLQTLANHIRANADADVVAALAIRNDAELTRLYGLDSAFIVWKSSVEPLEYKAALDYTETEGMDAAKQTSFEWMTGGLREAFDATVASNQAAIPAIFPNSGPGASPNTQAAMLAAMKRAATVTEEIFATGTGSSGDPGLLTFVGAASLNDISDALNKF